MKVVEAEGIAAAVLLHVHGRVDGDTARQLEKECEQRMQPVTIRMILDLSAVEYISSAGLGSVLITGKKLDAGGGELILSGLPPKIRNIFKFTGFESLFKIFETADAAVLYCDSTKG